MNSADSAEPARLRTLRAYNILDTAPEEEYDRLARLAARHCSTPMAVICFVDASRQWFKSVIGLDFRDTNRTLSFCSKVIGASRTIVVRNTLTSPLLASHPLVTGKPGIRFYAGAPLTAPDGSVLGTVAVMDVVPRELDEVQIETLEALADAVAARLERRRQPRPLQLAAGAHTAPGPALPLDGDHLSVQQRFNEFADAMPQIVWMADAAGQVDFINRNGALYSGFGIDPDTEKWFQALHPEDVARTRRAWETAVRTGSLYSTEYRLLRAADRSYRWHLATGVPIRNTAGEIVRWYGSCTDIHDAKVAHEEAARLAHQLSATLEAIQEGFFTLDAELRFTYVSQNGARLLVRERDALLGKQIWDACPDLDAGELQDKFDAVVSQQSPVRFDYFHVQTSQWWELHAYPWPGGIAVYFNDVTEQRRLHLLKVEQTVILERIAVGAPSGEILEAITRMADAQDPSCWCTIMLTTPDRQRLVSGTASRLPRKLREAVEGIAVGPANGACGTAVFERQMVVCNDIDNDPRWREWRELAHELGIRACWSHPVLSSTGEVFGTFAVYAPAARVPTPAEVGMLISCAHIVSIVLEREQAEARARKNEEHLRLRTRAIEACANPIAIVRAEAPAYPVEYVNPAFSRVMGYGPEHIFGKSLRLLLRDQQDQPGLMEITAARDQQREGHATVEGYRRDGSRIVMDVYVAPVHDDTGAFTHLVAAMYDVTEARQYQAELEYQSNYDALTGLANRNLLRDRISQAIAGAAASGGRVWVVSINLDRFRFVNDTLGHEAGDVLLQLVGARLRTALQATDTAARVAGDEFVLVLTTAADEHAVSSRVQGIIESIGVPLTVKGHDYFLSCTAGIAAYPGDAGDAASLIRASDIAMHRAREIGRNRFQFYTATMNERALDRLRLEGDLRRAVAANELVLHYQPQLDVRTGRIIGLEALVRWEHPQLGLVPPERFIRIAEETGLIVPLGAWVMQAACRQNKEWQDEGLGAVRVAVNLSGNQFFQQDLVQSVASILEDTGLAADCLDIELTESVLMTDIDQALDIMHGLKKLGVQLSMDDFGTGYSSLSYLKRFPIDVLKIDRSFVHSLVEEPDAAAIARSIITLAHSLRLQVIAEGVETESQLGYLRQHQCDQIQGYYFSRPVPAAQIAQMLRDGKCLAGSPGGASRVGTLLVVDHDPGFASALQRMLPQERYHLLRAATPAQALDLLAAHDVQVVLCGHGMTPAAATRFLSQVKALHPQTVRMMLSDQDGADPVLEATSSGAVLHYNDTPGTDESLCASIADAFRYQRLMQREHPA